MLQTVQTYKAADYPRLSRMPGFSVQLAANHMKLYQGYVTNTNALSEKLTAMLTDGKEKTPEYAELKRRFGWEFNGMRLHELYFGNMGSDGIPQRSAQVYKTILEDFGSFETWKKDFIATGLMRGVGWVALYQDNVSGRVFNVWVNEHDGGHLAGCMPLLVLDVFEHAYITDYQLERAKYIEAFFNVIDWEAVSKRCAK
ncbi:MAG: superoxide dismutase [Elusimicrobia bacterium GWA2_56_46]|nr:MAG: superoxide dismutase [Elusimicrobia bacterium GWA2_56_46]OGR55489.1 MAG: superoxide dismutase [Elusimicrobia bacterium GWC2_56_31]HBW22526.1 superoxide dismutase [Elusimicrobiota bacterium]